MQSSQSQIPHFCQNCRLKCHHWVSSSLLRMKISLTKQLLQAFSRERSKRQAKPTTADLQRKFPQTDIQTSKPHQLATTTLSSINCLLQMDPKALHRRETLMDDSICIPKFTVLQRRLPKLCSLCLHTKSSTTESVLSPKSFRCSLILIVLLTGS